MATVRELTAKLNFQVDTSQAEKFQRNIRDVNTALKSIKTSKFVESTRKIVTAIRGMRKAFKSGGLKRRVTAWMRGAGNAIKEKSKSFLDKLKNFASNINLKAIAIRGAMAAVAAATASVMFAASKESAETRALGLSGDRGVAALKENYKTIRKLSRGMYDEKSIAKAGAAFLGINNNVEAMNKLFPIAARTAQISGRTIEEEMVKFANLSVHGGESSAADTGLYDERELELINSGKRTKLSDMSNPMKLDSIVRQYGKKSGQINKAHSKSFGDTSTKLGQLKGEWSQAGINTGESLQSTANDILDGGIYMARMAQGKTNFKMPTIGGMMGPGGGGQTVNDNRTININASTPNEAELVVKIKEAQNRENTAAYWSNKALDPFSRGFNQ